MKNTIQNIINEIKPLKQELIRLYNTIGEYNDVYEVLRDKIQYLLDDIENILCDNLELYYFEEINEYLMNNFNFEFFNAMDSTTFMK